jgi:hypothetical protein
MHLLQQARPSQGLSQVPVAATDVPKMAIITPFGLFEFLLMPFGLRNAGMTFQRLMDSLLGNLPFAFMYLDDILVASPSAAEHRRHLAVVFSLLQDSGLIVNVDKCMFGVSSIEFLGHSIGPSGIKPYCLPVCLPSPSFLAQSLSGSCRLFSACSTFTGDLFQRRHASSCR